jgi:hypothetical protein
MKAGFAADRMEKLERCILTKRPDGADVFHCKLPGLPKYEKFRMYISEFPSKNLEFFPLEKANRNCLINCACRWGVAKDGLKKRTQRIFPFYQPVG